MDDKAIIRMFWNRNEQAISETEKKYGALCKSLAVNILNQAEDAEECVNDTYLAVWNAIPTDTPRVFSAYICKIVKNLSYKKLEYNTAKKRNSQMTVSFDELSDCISGGQSPEDEFIIGLVSEKISEFLWKESERNRRIFVRRYWFYDSVSKISNDFGISEKTVSVILFRTRKKLKEYLIKEGFEL